MKTIITTIVRFIKSLFAPKTSKVLASFDKIAGQLDAAHAAATANIESVNATVAKLGEAKAGFEAEAIRARDTATLLRISGLASPRHK